VTRSFEIFVAQISDFPPKSRPNVLSVKISTPKPFLKPQNIYIKPDLKLQNIYIKANFETSYIGKKIKKLSFFKSSPKIANSLGEFRN